MLPYWVLIVTTFFKLWMWIDHLPTTFRKIFQDIFSSFEFGSKLDPQNIGLLGGVVCDHIYRLAFNLCNLWESTLEFMRKLYRGRKRVGSINYNLIRDVSYEYSKHYPILANYNPLYKCKNHRIDRIEMTQTRTARGDDPLTSSCIFFQCKDVAKSGITDVDPWTRFRKGFFGFWRVGDNLLIP